MSLLRLRFELEPLLILHLPRFYQFAISGLGRLADILVSYDPSSPAAQERFTSFADSAGNVLRVLSGTLAQARTPEGERAPSSAQDRLPEAILEMLQKLEIQLNQVHRLSSPSNPEARPEGSLSSSQLRSLLILMLRSLHVALGFSRMGIIDLWTPKAKTSMEPFLKTQMGLISVSLLSFESPSSPEADALSLSFVDARWNSGPGRRSLRSTHRHPLVLHRWCVFSLFNEEGNGHILILSLSSLSQNSQRTSERAASLLSETSKSRKPTNDIPPSQTTSAPKSNGYFLTSLRILSSKTSSSPTIPRNPPSSIPSRLELVPGNGSSSRIHQHPHLPIETLTQLVKSSRTTLPCPSPSSKPRELEIDCPPLRRALGSRKQPLRPWTWTRKNPGRRSRAREATPTISKGQRRSRRIGRGVDFEGRRMQEEEEETTLRAPSTDQQQQLPHQ